ncbi:hypothetical protein PV328_008812 [Microctonus aethiopoides]|uniref:CHHC U11-48K-type domain-containing protein n=1 Tax=Microctonus aethiopoides TaxID=144406 RepID=A0AA39FK24_9HYME|nr:hypothetical protein PV328_008812 [Microctonus aethiopoides]
MENETLERDKYTNELRNFINSTDKNLNELLTCLEWNENSIQEVQSPLICPFDSSHYLCEKSLEKHLEKCQWKAEGYDDMDLPLSVPTVSSNSPSCITFDERLQEHVLQLAKLTNSSMPSGIGGRLIPRTSDRLTADFTSDERRVLYDYAVANTTQPDIGEDIADLNKPKKCDDNKPSSYLELLAQERNLKRRRAKHRGVHTNKKSQIEICREVINQQMEMLAEYIAEKTDLKTAETVDHSSRMSDEFKIKNNLNNEKRKSVDKYNHNSTDNYSSHDYHNHHHRSRRSADKEYRDNYKRDNDKNHHKDDKHLKYRRKSSKEDDRHRDRNVETKKHDKNHKRHHSKHRHRSHERESSKYSKKSKYDDRKNDKRRN